MNTLLVWQLIIHGLITGGYSMWAALYRIGRTS